MKTVPFMCISYGEFEGPTFGSTLHGLRSIFCSKFFLQTLSQSECPRSRLKGDMMYILTTNAVYVRQVLVVMFHKRQECESRVEDEGTVQRFYEVANVFTTFVGFKGSYNIWVRRLNV